MVRLKREETHATNDPEPHYHLPSANHNQEIFDRIVEACKEELSGPFKVVEFEDPGKTKARIIDGHDILIHLNCYDSDAGRRLKITPYDDEFFEETFLPIVDGVDAPEGRDLSFRWEPLELDVGVECDVCGERIEEGAPVLGIASPRDVDAGENIMDVPGIQIPEGFTCCCDCAEVDQEQVSRLPFEASISPHQLVEKAKDRGPG